MKKLFALIEKESAKFAQLPFFEFLGNKSIDLIQRLSFAPCFALFLMGYGDLNKFVCLEQPTVNPIPDVVNNQIREEENHGIWVLKNLEDLNFNLFLNITDSSKINFSDRTGIFRQIIYELYRRTFQVNPIYKLVAIESIESISNIFLSIFLSITAPITQKLKFLNNREYPYFRNPHLLAENDHNVHSHQTKEFIASMHLAEDICKQSGELVIEEEFRSGAGAGRKLRSESIHLGFRPTTFLLTTKLKIWWGCKNAAYSSATRTEFRMNSDS